MQEQKKNNETPGISKLIQVISHLFDDLEPGSNQFMCRRLWPVMF